MRWQEKGKQNKQLNICSVFQTKWNAHWWWLLVADGINFEWIYRFDGHSMCFCLINWKGHRCEIATVITWLVIHFYGVHLSDRKFQQTNNQTNKKELDICGCWYSIGCFVKDENGNDKERKRNENAIKNKNRSNIIMASLSHFHFNSIIMKMSCASLWLFSS